MRILKHKKILTILCLCVLFSVFFSFSASAYSTIMGNGNSDFAISAPGTIDVSLRGSTLQNSTLTYYTFAANFSPIIKNSYFSYDYTMIDDTVTNYGCWRGTYWPSGSTVEPFGDGVSYIGTSRFNVEFFKFYPHADLLDSNFSLTNTVMYLRDFYCWNYDFEDIDTDNELSLTFDYKESSLRVAQIIVKYGLAGDSEINEIIIDAVSNDDISSGEINLTPELLGLTDENLLVYIYECQINFTGVPTSTYDTLYYFNVNYTLNPYVRNFSGLSIDDNPALALKPFALWIGDAVSGFMDFELFNGFSLGGIFVTIVAFLCVTWFLKLVAGG